MAALCGLNILLLWAGIISLAKSPPSPLCSYTVTVTNSEFQLNITSSTAGKYNMDINEEGQPETMKSYNFEHLPQTSSREIPHLKLCAVYEHNVTFLDSNDEKTPCDSGGDKILMNTMDLKIINTKMTNTSIDLSWNTTSQNCQDDLPNLQGLSYDCSCFPSDQKHSNEVNKHKQANGETCHVAGLEPYTSYTCEIQPTYHNKKVRQPTVVQQRTEIGIPGDITGVMAVSEHNVIRVTCTHTNRLNGPEEQYIARLYDASVRLKELKANNCEFEFKDLNYSSYRLEVTVFNGKFESKPKTQDVVTHQSFKGVFIMVFFAIFTITLAVAVYVTKCRKSRNDVNENVILESTAGAMLKFLTSAGSSQSASGEPVQSSSSTGTNEPDTPATDESVPSGTVEAVSSGSTSSASSVQPPLSEGNKTASEASAGVEPQATVCASPNDPAEWPSVLTDSIRTELVPDLT